jgi:hypothetical protein
MAPFSGGLRNPAASGDSLGVTALAQHAGMTTSPMYLLQPETGPMLFADCPFCLAPLPLDALTGTMECRDCQISLELADEPEPLVLAPAA